MATMTTTKINELAEQSQGFIPQAAEQPMMAFLSLAPTSSAPYTPKPQKPVPERRASGFLTLAPTVSASYPRPRHQSVSHLTRPLPLTHGPHPEALVSPPPTAPASVISETGKTRRSSSMSSDGSLGSKARLRFLKLGPVHWGEHQGEHKEDWHDVDEEALSP